MRPFLPVLILLGLPALAHSQPSGWSASSGATVPGSPPPILEMRRSDPDVTPRRAARFPDCEVKPVMTDVDYRRCGARPPSEVVDFTAPWPAPGAP